MKRLSAEQIEARRAQIRAAFPAKRIPRGMSVAEAARLLGYCSHNHLKTFVQKHAWDLLPQLSERPRFKIGSPLTTRRTA